MRKPFKSAAEGTSKPSGPRDLGELTTPRTRDEALHIRSEGDAEIEILQSKRPAWHHQRAREKAVKLLTTQYLEAVETIRESASQEELEALRDVLTDRIERGWKMTLTPNREELFRRLIAEYELVEDALDESILGNYLSRVHHWGTAWPA